MRKTILFPMRVYVVRIGKIVRIQERKYNDVKFKPLSRVVGAMINAGAVIPYLKVAVQSCSVCSQGGAEDPLLSPVLYEDGNTLGFPSASCCP